MANCPTVQLPHAVAPAEECLPAAHGVHALDASLSPSCWPAAHCVQTVEPLAAYLPAAQVVQALARVPEYLPAPQSTHCVAGLESLSKRPAEHTVQEVELAAEYSPLVQPTQRRKNPGCGEYLPAAHTMHAVACESTACWAAFQACNPPAAARGLLLSALTTAIE